MKKFAIRFAIMMQAMIVLFVVGYNLRAWASEVILDEDLPNDGVLVISAGDLGEYNIDTRFNLCFLVSRTVVEVSCKPFDNLHGNE